MIYKITDKHTMVDNNMVLTYGVKCGDEYVDDISANKLAVQDFVNKLNNYGLSIIHLKEVVEDFVIEH